MPTQRQPLTHIPSKRPVISRAMAEAAARTLRAALDGDVDSVRARAATDLLRLYQTQDRYTPERVAQLAQTTNRSEAIHQLAEMTPETLNRLTETMMGDYPSRQKPS